MASRRATKDLTKLSKDLTALARDLVGCQSDLPTDWNAQCRARHSAGDTLIGQWDLAERFLVVWLDFRELLDRWQRYYGHRKEIALAWREANALGESAAARLLSEPAVPALVLERSARRFEVGQSIGDVGMILDELAYASDLTRIANIVQSSRGDSQRELLARSEQNSIRVLERVRALPVHQRRDVEEHLRHFNRATLAMGVTGRDDAQTPIRRFFSELYQRNRMPELSKGDRSDEGWRIISNVLNPLQRDIESVIDQVGYDSLIEQLLDNDVQASEIFGRRETSFNIIPGDIGAQCCELLLAFSTGSSKGPLSFRNLLTKVRLHLINCAPQTPTAGKSTKVAAIFVDSWDGPLFDDEFFDDFAAFHSSRGVEFVFLLVPPARAGSGISEIKVHLS